MINRHVIHTADYHVAGEPARILISGFPVLRGSSMLEKLRYFETNFDYIRKSLMREPRGFNGMFGVVLAQPTVEEADVGAFFMDGGGYTKMCGHGTLCLAHAVTELGLAQPKGPEGKLVIETPAGIVHTFVRIEDVRPREVTLRNLPSFLYTSEAELHVPSIGLVKVDVAFGGIFFVMADAEALGLDLTSSNVDRLVNVALALRRKANEDIHLQHPDEPSVANLGSAVIYGPPCHPLAHQRNIDVFGKGQFDRSPCGTATSARMAVLHARGQLGLNEDFINESIVGTLLNGRLVEVTKVGDYNAVIPEITGEPFITGLNNWIVDTSDPLYDGLVWGKDAAP